MLRALILIIFLTLPYAFAKDNYVRDIVTDDNIQGFVLGKKDVIYTMELNGKLKSSSLYSYSNSGRNLFLSDPDIGHQGFSIYEKDENNIYALTSALNDAYHALIFYVQDGKLESKRLIKFFDSDFYSVNETMPTISSDQRYLIVRGRLASRKMIFRVYDFDVVKKAVHLNDQTVDLSSSYKYQWLMPADNLVDSDGNLRPLQSIASDGKKIYLLLGNSKINDKAIFSYSLSGNIINYATTLRIGIKRALSDGNGYFYEPEGLAVAPGGNSLLVLIVTGNGGKHFNRIFSIDKLALN
ncbi:phage baseplate protein [Yersinia massiliensis]|uniref:phage baseplate protein n=1 Tax=Yersinia massiliensis TaxID=419257 RepID=UPI00119FA155|nr:hypothetical protein [Yersinia massiliensis]MCB5307038.1 hypothetical protein [Yersinia massiliensis]